MIFPSSFLDEHKTIKTIISPKIIIDRSERKFTRCNSSEMFEAVDHKMGSQIYYSSQAYCFEHKRKVSDSILTRRHIK